MPARAHARLAVLALLALVPALPSCNIVGPAFLLVHGPEKIKKLHTLDPRRPTVIFVDDRRNLLPRRALRQAMAETAQRVLLDDKTLVNVIDARSALAATTRDKSSDPMNITEIGRSVEAEVVVYATIDQFVLSPDGQTFAPRIAMRVKVIDAAKDERQWPTDDKNGYLLSTAVPTRQGYVPKSQAEFIQAEDETAQFAGLALAQIFMDHALDETAIKKPEQ